jgi:hypothetical protein
MTQYKLIQSKRKTLTIKILEDATLEVRAPFNFPPEEIDKIIDSNKEKINEKSKAILKKHKLKKSFKLDFKSQLLVRGKTNFIKAINDKKPYYNEDEKTFFIPKDFDSITIKKTLIELYKLIAKSYFIKRVNYFKEIMDLEPSNVKVNSAKKRWGSCGIDILSD